MTGPSALEYQHVAKGFFGVPVLHDVSFALGPGQVLGLVGENGAGKSTLMNILGGVLQADAGQILVGGAAYQPRSPSDARTSGIAFIHQELNLFPNLSVAENVFLTALPRRRGVLPFVDWRALHDRTAALLRTVKLDVTPDTLVEALSPGQRQLVEIAKALSIDARVVIFDEPTTSLTAPEAEHLFALIEKLRGEGRAVVYISHALQDVLRLADNIVVLRDGQVVGAGARAEFSIDRLVTLMVGRRLEQLFPPRAAFSGGERLLEARGLAQPGIIEDVSFSLHAGEVLGIAGLMGSGRTELARILFGLDPAAGQIVVRGEEFARRSPAAAIERGMAFLTESRREEGLLMNAGIGENVALAGLRRFAAGAARGGWVDDPRLRTAVVGQARAAGIAPGKLDAGDGTSDARVRTLSGGNQQKVVLARWLLTEPKIFILDEPTRGVDVGAKHEIYALINELVGRGAGVLVISSELEELIGLCDRILVMRRGALAGALPRAAFDRETILRLALGDA